MNGATAMTWTKFLLVLVLAPTGCGLLGSIDASLVAHYDEIVAERGAPPDQETADAWMAEAWERLEVDRAAQDGIVGEIVHAVPGGVGTIVSGLYALALMIGRRSREHLAAAGKATLRGRLPTAGKRVLAAIGPVHTATVAGAAPKAAAS